MTEKNNFSSPPATPEPAVGNTRPTLDIDSVYKATVDELIFFRLKIMVALGIFLHLMFTVMDERVYPAWTSHFLHVRIFDSVVGFLISISGYIPSVRKKIEWPATMASTVLGLGVCYMIAVTNGASSRYYEGINLTIFALLFINGFRWRANLASCLIQIGGYVAAVLVHGNSLLSQEFLTAFYFISSTAIFTLLMTKFFSDQHRNAFFKNEALKRSEDDLSKTNAELSRLYQEAEQQARRDLLTGLFNNATFHDALKREFSLAKRHQTPLSVVFVDLDYFKEINDTFGHQGGDEVLKAVAKVLKEHSRETDVAARYGGDEMALLLPHTAAEQARIWAERVDQRLKETSLEAQNGPSHISASIGVAEIMPIDETYQMLLVRADEAVYKSKESGRGRVSLWDPSCRSDNRKSVAFLEKINNRRAADRRSPDPIMPTTARRWITYRLNEDFIRDVGKELGLTETEIIDLKIAYILRDIGIAGIPDSILSKQEALTTHDWNVIKSHTKIGRDLLLRASSQFERVAEAIYHHHEKWNGTGYPQGLEGKSIPRLARIVAVMDAFSAMVSERPYHAAIAPSEALKKISAVKGTQFDPDVADIFIAVCSRYADRALAVSDDALAA